MYLYIYVYVEKIKNNDLYFVVLEFNDNCVNIDLCNFFIYFKCSNNKCFCVSIYYYKE